MEKKSSLLIITACLPFILWGVSGILPTFDDYTTLQSTWWVQIADPGYFFPDAIRRPWDALFGLFVGHFPALFPVLNHVVIILGHTLNACLVFSICSRLGLKPTAVNMATLFFFFSPATLGATLACDGLNQTYAQLWGLMALWIYLFRRSWLWIACIVMAALSKENGLAWAVVPPVVAYAFGRADRRQAMHHVGTGLIIAVCYAIVFIAIMSSGIFNIEYDESYMHNSWTAHAKDLAQLLAFTWLPIDFVSALYAPTRNWTMVALTAATALPFLIVLIIRGVRQLNSRRLLLIILCYIILASPHIVSLVSIMHNYAPLSMAAMMVAIIIDRTPAKKSVVVAFSLFLLADIVTDLHHYQAARESGQLSRHMATQALEQTDLQTTTRVLCINIDDPSEPHYSSFCVRPVDAFAWGLSAIHFSHYTFKPTISELTLPSFDAARVEALADSALQAGCDAVWVAGHGRNLLCATDSLNSFSKHSPQ